MTASGESAAPVASQDGAFVRTAKRHPVLTFVVLTYLLAWGLVTPKILYWLGVIKVEVSSSLWVSASFLAPGVAGLFVQWVTKGNLRVVRVCDSLLRLVLGVIVGFTLVVVLDTIVPAVLVVRDPIHTLQWSVFFSIPAYHFLWSDPILPLGEEIGWRGFALPRLQARYGPVRASILVGLMWAGFTLPGQITTQMWGLDDIALYAVAMIGLSVEMTLVANLSGFSILAVAITASLLSHQTAYILMALTAHSTPQLPWSKVSTLSTLLIPSLLVALTRTKLLASTENAPQDARLQGSDSQSEEISQRTGIL